MKRSFFACLMLLFCCKVEAQRAVAKAALEKAHIAPAVLDSLYMPYEEQYSYDMIDTSWEDYSTHTYAASHDAAIKGDSAWTLTGRNQRKHIGGTMQRNFRNAVRPAVLSMPLDTASFRVEQEDGKQLVLSFRYDTVVYEAGSVDPYNRRFGTAVWRRAKVTVYFDKTSGRLQRMEASVEKPYWHGAFYVLAWNLATTYQYPDGGLRFLPKREELYCKERFGGGGREFSFNEQQDFLHFHKP